VTYTVQSSAVSGTISFSDDTTTRTVVLIGRAGTDGDLVAAGPYFLTVPKNGQGCENLRLINTGADADTISELVWSHGPAPMFSYDTTVTLPHVLAAHDTLYWSFCFHAPNDTLVHLDTITIHYRDAASSSRSLTRVVYAKAVDTTHPDAALTAVGPYWNSTTPCGTTNCQNMRVVNPGSDVDTLVSIAWTHDPAGLFSYDTTIGLPRALSPHDTLNWIVCFHAPSDTLVHVDTLVVRYRDAYNQDRSVRRIVSARATDTSLHECYTLYVRTIPITEVGDTAQFRLYIANRLDSAIELTALNVSGTASAAFRVDSSSFPRTIAGHQYDSLWLTFVPQSTSTSSFPASLTANFTTGDTTHCRTATLTITGHSAQAARDTEVVSLGDTSTRHIALVSDSASLYYSHRVDIVNNIGVRIRIDTVFLTGSSHMYIIQNIRTPFPDTLANGAKHSVIVRFYGDSSHTIYHDTLTVIMENALLPFYIYLDGYSAGALAGVNAVTVTSPAALRVYPNPSSDRFTVEPQGIINPTYQLFDPLGREITAHEGGSTWTWMAEGVASGHYFVRVTGVNILGEVVTVSRAIEVVRH
jgi:hypothetical protein